MHETAVAQSIMETISQESARIGHKPVAAIISCGTLNVLNEEVLRFAFEAMSQGTICEDVSLSVRQIPLQGKCNKCGEVFEYDINEPVCGNCGSDDFEFLPDAPIMIEEIEFEETQDEDKHPEEGAQRQ